MLSEEKTGLPKGNSGLDFDTVDISSDGRYLVIIDQTLLPGKVEFLHLDKLEDMREAIYLLKVRGAPAIGVAAAIGLYIEASHIYENYGEDKTAFFSELKKAKLYLETARPTAVNLKWALDRMYACAESMKESSVQDIAQGLKEEALRIKAEDIHVCSKLGEYGLTLLKKGQGILTHCNAGHLATVRYGTATAPIYLGHRQGYGFKVFADETRPLLQGARLTAFELSEAGVDVTLICDNMVSSVMQKGWVQTVITGCDRVAANGDAANKIGTSGVAVIAKHYGIPFYIAAPTSTIDFETETGEDIIIEERPWEEVKNMWYERPMAPEKASVYNPAFDVTDNSLISGIITEYGIAYPPFGESLKEIKKKMEIKL